MVIDYVLIVNIDSQNISGKTSHSNTQQQQQHQNDDSINDKWVHFRSIEYENQQNK